MEAVVKFTGKGKGKQVLRMLIDHINKIIEVDNHVLETFRTCEEKYRLTIHEAWRKTDGVAPLGFGIAMHAVRQHYKQAIREGIDQAKAEEIALAVGEKTWDAEMPKELKELVKIDDKRGKLNLVRLAKGYIKKYGGPEFETVVCEVPVKRYLGTTPDGWKVLYIGVMDEVVRYREKVWPLEFKTRSGSYPPDAKFFSQFHNKASITGYIWMVEQELGYEITGAIIHALWVNGEPRPDAFHYEEGPGGKKIRVPGAKYNLDDHFKMDYTYRTHAQVEEWKRNVLFTCDDIVRSVRENRWKRQDGSVCTLYSGCMMKSVCEATPDIRPQLLKIDFEQKPWNPWARLEESE